MTQNRLSSGMVNGIQRHLRMRNRIKAKSKRKYVRRRIHTGDKTLSD